MLPPSKHFEISIPLDAYNFWDKKGAIDSLGDCTYVIILFFLVDYRYTYLDLNCK